MSRPFEIEIVNSWQTIAPRWLRLQHEGTGTPFQNFTWLSTWYSVFCKSPDVEPVLVAVTDTRSGNDVLLIPLVRRAIRSLRSIEFADLWTTDYNAPLIGPDAPTLEEDCRALGIEVLNALPQSDIVRFTKMPSRIRGRLNPLAWLDGARESDVRGHVVQLPERWDDYVNSLKKDVRKHWRRRRRRFDQLENASLRQSTT